MIKNGFFALLLVALTSCMSIKYTNIEVLMPAAVEYPPDVLNVVLVNNAAEQPADVGHSNYLNAPYRRGKKMMKMSQDTVALDSTGFTCVFNAANQLRSAEFFKNVYVHPTAINTGPYYYLEQKLSEQQIQTFLEEYGADVVISLDKLTYESKLTVREVYADFYDYATIDVNFAAVWRVHYGNSSAAAQRVEVKDTIFWMSEQEENVLRLLPKAEAVSEGLWLSGEASGKRLAPYWDEVQRLYYNGGNTYFKLADRHYKAGNWEGAEEVWQYIYLTYKKQKKARAAVNLAYLNELKGDLHTSKDWLDKALKAYRNSSYAHTDEYKMILQYRKIIELRLLDEQMLKQQFEAQL